MYPRTFNEFYAQHPSFVRMLINKHRWGRYEDVDDLEQELLSEMIRKRVVEKFNPDIYGQGVNIRLFMSYLITCVERMYSSTHTQANAVMRRVNNAPVSLSQPLQDDDEGTSTLIDTLDDDGRASARIEATTELNDLSGYIAEHHPELNTTMSAVRQHQTVNIREIAQHIGLRESTVNGRMYNLFTLRSSPHRTVRRLQDHRLSGCQGRVDDWLWSHRWCVSRSDLHTSES